MLSLFAVNASCGVTFYIAEAIFLSPQGGQYVDIGGHGGGRLISHLSDRSNTTLTCMVKVKGIIKSSKY